MENTLVYQHHPLGPFLLARGVQREGVPITMDMYDAVLVRHALARPAIHSRRAHVIELTLASGRQLLLQCT